MNEPRKSLASRKYSLTTKWTSTATTNYLRRSLRSFLSWFCHTVSSLSNRNSHICYIHGYYWQIKSGTDLVMKPSDSVPCIQDVILDALQPLTNFYIQNEGLGLTLVSIMQLLVDIQLVLVLAYWFIWGDSMRYPIVLSLIGISKILLNVKLLSFRFYSRRKSSIIALLSRHFLQ